MRGLNLYFFLLILSSCTLIKPGKQKKDILFSIDDSSVKADEFIYNLKKNNYESDSTFTKEEINDYLDLYINFKLKVQDAYQQGLDTTDSFLNEFHKYRDQLTESYLKDDSIIHVLVKEAYNRMLIEVNASHILVSVQNFYNPADTLSAYDKIHAIHDQLKSGADFEELAVLYSEDPSAKINKGNLGYFTGLQMVYPFEKMAFNTSINDFSDPFKTRFGYHILKVNDKRKARGKAHVAHIMIRWSTNPSVQDSLIVYNKMQLVYDSLKSGGDWNNLCQKYSEDNNTKNSGGILQPFETGQIVPSFAEAAFALNNPGDISKPVMTPYGWHIIKLINKMPIQSFEDLQDELYNKVKNDSRSELTNKHLINRLKNGNEFVLFNTVKDSCLLYADSSLIQGNWSYDSLDSFIKTDLFLISSKSYTVNGFFQYVIMNQNINRTKEPGVYMHELLNKYIEESLIDYEKEHLAQKNYNYRMLVREYKEGILLFDLMEREVWNKAVQDTVGLEIYFKNNLSNYMWENERLDVLILSSQDIAEIDRAKSIIAKKYYPVDSDSVILNYPLNDKNISDIDSLFTIISTDTTLWLELFLPPNQKYKNNFLEFSEQKDWDINNLVYNSGNYSNSSIKLVSSAKNYLEKAINEKSDLNLLVESGVFEKGSNDIVDLIEWKEGSYDLSIEDTEYYVVVNYVIPPGPKNLEEVKGRVIADYQDYLEEKWISELKSKYSVTINEEVLTEIYSRFEN